MIAPTIWALAGVGHLHRQGGQTHALLETAESGAQGQYAAARACEAEGRFDEAYALLSAARQRDTSHGSADPSEAIFQAVRRLFAQRLPLVPGGLVDAGPVFVVGLPLTGTSLVSRIVQAHPRIMEAGASDALVRALLGTSGATRLTAAAIHQLEGEGADGIAQRYLDTCRAAPDTQSDRFVDHQPLNFLFVGFILQALPRASILCVRRGAMDSAWNLFSGAIPDPFAQWVQSTESAAMLVLEFQRLMEFWRQRFPGRIHDVHYEWQLADPEVETRRLLAPCGLEWHAECTIPEAVLREARDDCGRWRPYSAQLAEVAELFARHGIPLD